MAKARLGAALTELSGLLGEGVLVQMRSGPAVRRRPTYRRPTDANQQAAQTRMRAAMDAWNGLTHEQAMAWNAYANTLTRHNAVSGTDYHPTGQNVFVGLATKFLQVNPAGSVPLAPPTDSFAPDNLLVTATGGAGQIAFTATEANHAPIVTELLFQKLKTPRRSPTDFYKSLAFEAFTAGSLTVSYPLPPAHYAVAYRFVQTQTGQQSMLVTLGVLEVT